MGKAQVERRMAAILAADVVGYSRLMEADETSALSAIQTLRSEIVNPFVAKHHGRLVKLMGDGVLIEFSSAADAVTCAVAIQKANRVRKANVAPEGHVVLRIGINLGDVVVQGDDLLGHGVNVASRLEQLCEPGGVLISGTVYDNLPGRMMLPIEDAGPHQVKNISQPVRTYKVNLTGRSRPPARKWYRLFGGRRTIAGHASATPPDKGEDTHAAIARQPHIAGAAAIPQERRMSLIVVAEIVDYLRLLATDEAGTLGAVRMLNQDVVAPLVEEHTGRVVKVSDDWTLIEFSSAVDAVACAVAIQKKAKRRQVSLAPSRCLVLRIGVSLGDVIVQGSDLRGEGVSVATRLQQLCEPGRVLMSGTVYDHIPGRLTLPIEDAGEILIEGTNAADSDLQGQAEKTCGPAGKDGPTRPSPPIVGEQATRAIPKTTAPPRRCNVELSSDDRSSDGAGDGGDTVFRYSCL